MGRSAQPLRRPTSFHTISTRDSIDDVSSMDVAALIGHLEVPNSVLEQGVKVNVVNFLHETALYNMPCSTTQPGARRHRRLPPAYRGEHRRLRLSTIDVPPFGGTGVGHGVQRHPSRPAAHHRVAKVTISVAHSLSGSVQQVLPRLLHW